jgi:hypothetical protein
MHNPVQQHRIARLGVVGEYRKQNHGYMIQVKLVSVDCGTKNKGQVFEACPCDFTLTSILSHRGRGGQNR